MIRQVRVLQEAAEEAGEAAARYEAERPELGQQFEEAVYDSLALLKYDIVALATISRSLTNIGIRRIIMRRFPYSIVVRQVADVMEVIAFAHHSRNPTYWRDRISSQRSN